VLKNALLIIGSLAIALLTFEVLRAASDGPRFVFCQGPTQRFRQDPVSQGGDSRKRLLRAQWRALVGPTYRAYRAVANEWDHRPVVLNYFLGNDFRNNVAVEGDDDFALQLGEVAMAGAPQRALIRAHRFMRANSQVYNLAYAAAKIMTTGRRGKDLAPDRFALGAEITKGLLLSLGARRRRTMRIF
jgi:hypothetical protein